MFHDENVQKGLSQIGKPVSRKLLNNNITWCNKYHCNYRQEVYKNRNCEQQPIKALKNRLTKTTEDPDEITATIHHRKKTSIYVGPKINRILYNGIYPSLLKYEQRVMSYFFSYFCSNVKSSLIFSVQSLTSKYFIDPCKTTARCFVIFSFICSEMDKSIRELLLRNLLDTQIRQFL